MADSCTNPGSYSRLEHIDILKAVGIICVLIGHLYAPLPIKVFIYSFHMPLFFLISGFFLKTDRSLGFILSKSLRHLMIPYLITYLAMTLIDVIFNGISADRMINRLMMFVYGISSNIVPGEHFDITQIGPIWFLLALFWAQMIVVMTWHVKVNTGTLSRLLRGMIIILLSLIAIITGYRIWMPLAFLNGVVASIFVWIGSEAKEQDLRKVLYKRSTIVIASVIWMICLIADYLRGMHFSISIFQFPLYGLGFIGAVCGAIVLLNLSRGLTMINLKPVMPFLSNIGRSTLEIMCVHAVDIETVRWPNGGVLRRKHVSLRCGYW